MGYIKQLHIDCTPHECVVNQYETCYMQEEDYDPLFDEDQEDIHGRERTRKI